MKRLAIDEALKRNCIHAISINQENLMQILSDNAKTEFGKRYKFSEIKNIEEYRSHIPLMEYSDFSSYIQKMREGEKNQLTVYPIVSYCQTSGTLGEPKYIPVSNIALNRYSNYFERYKNEVLHEYGGKRFLINAFRTDLEKPIEPVSIFSEIYFRYLYESGLMNMEEYFGACNTIFIRKEADMLYAKVWLAFLAEDITLLECQFLYELLHFFSYMEENWQNILKDMRKHSIPDTIVLPQEIKDELLSQYISEKRLSYVQKECEKGFENIAIRLWKNLRQVSGVSNRAYLTEEAVLRKYLGDIKRYYLCYCASECYLGAPLYEDEFGYVLIPQNAFFEFLPYKKEQKSQKNQENKKSHNSQNNSKKQSQKNEKEETATTLLPHELKEGELYEPVITNFSGLYRYRLGDIVKIIDFFGESPVMEFMFRKNQALNIAGEKIDMQQLEDAIYSLREYGIFVEQYLVGVTMEKIPGKYLVAITLEKDLLENKYNSEEIGELFDLALKKRNMDYADLRELKELDAPKILLFEHHSYTELLESQGMKKKHGHNKPKHICPKEVLEEEWKKQQSIK